SHGEMQKSPIQSLTADLKGHLERRLRSGERWVYPGASVPPVVPERPAAAPARESLEVIREDVGDCTRCKLSRGRTNLVCGAGNPHARLMFVGEGPGQDEAEQG